MNFKLKDSEISIIVEGLRRIQNGTYESEESKRKARELSNRLLKEMQEIYGSNSNAKKIQQEGQEWFLSHQTYNYDSK